MSMISIAVVMIVIGKAATEKDHIKGRKEGREGDGGCLGCVLRELDGAVGGGYVCGCMLCTDEPVDVEADQ